MEDTSLHTEYIRGFTYSGRDGLSYKNGSSRPTRMGFGPSLSDRMDNRRADAEEEYSTPMLDEGIRLLFFPPEYKHGTYSGFRYALYYRLHP